MYRAKRNVNQTVQYNSSLRTERNCGLEPIQLLDTGMNGDELCLISEAFELIECEKRLVSVIAITGPSRSGKSYLMNRLMGQTNGFPLGSSVQAKTKGFWLWKGDFPQEPSRCLILLDVEGLLDPMKGNPTHDLKLFTQALLSSSMFIYNTMGTIDASAMDGLHFATKMAEEMMSENADDECATFGEHFPHFVWAIRDQFLELKIDDRVVSSKEFLEDRLKPRVLPPNVSQELRDNIEDYNDLRGTLREFFPKRDCFVFPRPAIDEKMASLDQVRDDELNPKFKEAADNFVAFVFKTVKSKQIRGTNLSGRAFARMFKNFLASVNNKAISITSTFQMVAHEENQKAFGKAVKRFEKVFSQSEFPISAKKFDILSQKASEEGHNAFLTACIEIKDTQKLLEELSATFKEMTDEREKENFDASTQKCREMLGGHFEAIESNIEVYLVDGGYDLLKADIDLMKLTFETNCAHNEDIGIAQHDVLREFQKEKFLPLLNHVFQTDKQMSELKKKEAQAKLEAEKVSEENRRLEADIVRQEAAMEAAKNAAEANLKKTTDKLEEQHNERMEQMKKHVANQELELDRIRNDVTASAEWKKKCEEMLEAQKKELEESERRHRQEREESDKRHKEMMETMKEERKAAKREADEKNLQLQRIEKERAAAEKEKATAGMIGAICTGISGIASVGHDIYKTHQKYNSKK